MSGATGAFLRARLGALYALSLASCYAALAAWRPAWIDRPWRAAVPAILLGLAAIAGQALQDRLSLLAERVGRGRFRAAGATAHGLILMLGLLGLSLRLPTSASGAVRMLLFFHPLFLLLAGLGRGHQGTLLNAVALTVFASLAGGVVAAVAVVSCAMGVLIFLSADHHARLLLEYSAADAPGPRLLWREALAPAAALGVALSLVFVLVPPRPFAAFVASMPGSTAAPDVVMRLLVQLLGISVVAGIAFYLLMRWSGSVGESDGESDYEKAAARRRPEPLPASVPPAPEPALEGWRSRVVRVYVKALEQLARWGLRRRPSQTPAEFARRLEPEGDAASLTALFVRARYGAEELSEQDFEEAERAARSVLRGKQPPA